MKLLVIVNKLNKRSKVPASFAEKDNVIGVVMKGFVFEGKEVTNVPNPAMGKWFVDRSGAFYWGGGLLVTTNTSAEK